MTNRLSVRVTISALLLVVVLRAVPFDWTIALTTLAQARWWDLSLAVLVQIASVYCGAQRMRLIFALDGRAVSGREIWRSLLIGEALNRIAPGNVGSLAYLTARYGGNERGRLLSLLIAEKVLFLFCVLSAGVIAALCLGIDWLGGLLTLSVLGLAFSVWGFGSLASLHPRLQVARDWIAPILAGLWRRPKAMASYLAAVSFGLAGAMVAFALVLHAIGIRIGVPLACACTTLVTVASAMPITLNGVGLREWIITAFMQPQFKGGGFAAYVLLSYLVGFCVSACGALVAIVRPRDGAVATPEEASPGSPIAHAGRTGEPNA